MEIALIVLVLALIVISILYVLALMIQHSDIEYTRTHTKSTRENPADGSHSQIDLRVSR